MTGPPTPPPTSELEIQDAARNAAPAATQVPPPPAPPAVAPPPPAPPAVQVPVAAPPPATLAAPYRLMFPTLCSLAASGKLNELIAAAEDLDTSVSITGNKLHPDRMLIIIPLVLSYLIIDDIPPAQFALSRLPTTFTAHVIPQALMRLVASAAERKYEKIYPRAEDVHRTVQAADIGGADLKTIVGILLKKFVETFRMRTFALLSRAFASIPVPLVQQYLGSPAEQVLSIAQQYKWNYDQAHNVLYPVPTSINDAGAIGKTTGQCTIATLKTLNVMDSFE